MVPMVVEAIAVVFALPGVDNLVLYRDTIGYIFSGVITHWDDKEILRWNPTLTLPHEPIRVHVRESSSGVTELFTKAMKSFGHWNGEPSTTWYTDAELPNAGIHLTRDNDIVGKVKSTPYSIGFNGLTETVLERVTFATVVNKAGTLTIPGRNGGTDNLATLKLDHYKLTGDMVDGLGYPIAGLSCIAIKKNSPLACEVMKFAMYVLERGAGVYGKSKVLQLFDEFPTPLDGAMVNEILNQATIKTCGAVDGHAIVRVSIEMSEEVLPKFLEPVEEGGILYYTHPRTQTWTVVSPVQSGKSVSQSGFVVTAPTTVNGLGIIDELHEAKAGETKIPFAIGSLILAANIGVSGGLNHINLDLLSIRAMMRGRIKTFAHEVFYEQNPFMQDSDDTIVWVTDKENLLFTLMVSHLNAEDDAVTPTVVLKDQLSVAQYLKENKGAVAVMLPEVAELWDIIEIYPIVGGVPLSPDITRIETELYSLALEHKAWPWYLPRARDVVYPFFTIWYITLPTELLNAPDTNGTCAIAKDTLYPVMDYLIRDAQVDTVLHKLGFAEAYRCLKAAVEEGEANELEIREGELTCNGELIFPQETSSKSNMVTIVIIAVSVAVGLQILAIVWWQYSKHKAEVERKHRVRFAPTGKKSDGGGSCNAAIVFTDVYRSTRLWADQPSAMKKAVALHFSIARELVDEHHGYEIKTVGDSVMYAFKQPYDAVLFASTFQERLYEANWPLELQESEFSCEDPDKCLSGLRVRVGVNAGTCSAVPTSYGGFDYDGHVVNVASRIGDSGNGGQVLMSQDVYNMIVADADESLDIKYVGDYMFTGVPRPTGVFQVLPASLAQRQFGELRKAERVVNRDDDGTDQQDVNAAHQQLRKYVFRFGPYGMPADRASELVDSVIRDGVEKCGEIFRCLMLTVIAAKKGLGSSKGGSSASGGRNTNNTKDDTSTAFSQETGNTAPSSGRGSKFALGDAIMWPEFYAFLKLVSGSVSVHMGAEAEKLAAAQ
jgi:class 3 adenylate cyclase